MDFVSVSVLPQKQDMISKKKIAVIFILFCTLPVFGVFNNTPINKWLTFLMLPFSTYGHVLFFRYKNQFPKVIKNWYLIGLLIIIVSMLTSFIHYRQSLIDSFVATQNFYRVGLVVFIYYLIIKYKVSIKELFNPIIFIGWVNLLILIFLWSIDFSIDFTTLSGDVKVITYGKFSKAFMFFSAIYYLAMFLIKGKYKFLIFSILFFSIPHLDEIQRVLFLSSMILVFMGFLLVNSIKIRLKLLLPGIFVLIVSTTFLFSTEQGASVINRFEELAKYINSNDNSKINDSSVAVRIQENAFALEGFFQHPLTGNGFYRSSNKVNVVGDIYFYPLDIGLIGILFTLGIFGVIIFIYQYISLFKIIKNNRHHNVYSLASVLGLLFLMLFSLSAGTSINNFSIFLFYFVLLKFSSKYKIMLHMNHKESYISKSSNELKKYDL